MRFMVQWDIHAKPKNPSQTGMEPIEAVSVALVGMNTLSRGKLLLLHQKLLLVCHTLTTEKNIPYVNQVYYIDKYILQ